MKVLRHPGARFVARRLALMVPTFFGITALTFVIAQWAPGDPLSLDSESGVGRATDAVREHEGLHRPVLVQYVAWLGRLVRLDWGRSLTDHRDVADKVFEALPKTVVLSGLALALAWLFAVPLGVWLARTEVSPRSKGARWAARAVSAALALVSGVPAFWVAVLALFTFANPGVLDWLPFQGLSSPAHAVLPVACLMYPTLAFASRQVSGAMQAALRQDFVKAARARGIPERAVIWRHAFRNALLPLVTVLGFQLPHVISGSVVIERVFGISGMGALALDSVGLRDYPVVMAIATLSAVTTMFAMLAADVVALLLDPRVRSAVESGGAP